MRLPFNAVPGQLDEGTMFRLGVTAGPVMGLAAIVALLVYSRYRLSREEHADILLQLQARADRS